MSNNRSAGNDFAATADRRRNERERLVQQLADPDRRRVAEMREQHQQEVSERRKTQGECRSEDIDKEFTLLIREHARPVLRPTLAPLLQPSGKDFERMAANAVDDRNRTEIAGMTLQYERDADRFLNARGLSYDQFQGEREQLNQQRESTRSQNDVTRQI
jgi:hypothetical protein